MFSGSDRKGHSQRLLKDPVRGRIDSDERLSPTWLGQAADLATGKGTVLDDPECVNLAQRLLKKGSNNDWPCVHN